MRIKYNRTSTIQQNGNHFELDKDQYDLILFDHGVSGTISFKERQHGKYLTDLIKSGKVNEVVIEDLSRLGRNTIDTINTLKFFDDYKVNVVIKSMGLQSRPNNQKNPIWNLVTNVISSLYELERENILERTEMGRKVYVMNGGILGRPKNSNESDRDFLNKTKSKAIISLLSKGKSIRDIAGRLNCSTKTVVKVNKLMN